MLWSATSITFVQFFLPADTEVTSLYLTLTHLIIQLRGTKRVQGATILLHTRGHGPRLVYSPEFFHHSKITFARC